MDHSHHNIPSVDHYAVHHAMEAAAAALGEIDVTSTQQQQLLTPAAATTPATTFANVAHAGHDMSMHAGHDMSMHASHEHMHGSGGTGTGMEHMMSMAFHFGYNETILFSWWHIETIPGLIGSMIGIFLLALLYEGLKYYREYLFWKTYNLLEYRPVVGQQQGNPEAPRAATNLPTAAAGSPVQYVGEVVHKQPPSMFSLNHIFQTFLHMLQVTLSFLLMLIFMTYNVWLCLTVVLGASVGYFLFCWKKSVIVDVTEHCH